jgi:uncharacterized protein (DUF1330 family)
MAAYFLFDNLEVTDPNGLARYAKQAAKTVADHGGRYLATAATPEVFEGEPAVKSLVLIEFPDIDAARAWYDSPAYQRLKALRHRSARNTAVLFSR